MTDKLDMSLDDIINQNRSQYRLPARGRGRGRGNRGRMRGNFAGYGMRSRGGGRSRLLPYSTPRESPEKWQHDLFDGSATRMRTSVGQTKLLVSNLDYGVSDSDIKELFSEFGPLRKAAVHYDRSGRSLGTADVIFERRSDAVRAMKKYNGVLLDGRPLNIQITSSTVPSTSRVGGAGFSGGRSFNRNRLGRGQQSRGAASSGRRKIPTAEELDAELDAYVNKME